MSLQTFTRVKSYTKYGLLIAAVLFFARDLLAWDIDLSRRQSDLRRREASIPSEAALPSVVKINAPQFIEGIFPAGTSQEIVILNTGKAFIPSSIQIHKGQKYTIHVVNVSEKDKNVSFILDSFAQHFGTFYGVTKSFVIEPATKTQNCKCAQEVRRTRGCNWRRC